MIPTLFPSSCALAMVLAVAAAGQDRRVDQALIGRPAGAQQGQEQLGVGVAVRMFESPTLDRFLRKAEDFLAREDFAGAIKVLQDVLEGDIHPGEEPEQPDAAPADNPEGPLGNEDDPTHAVFSSDERLYRPVRRLCQELLAAMPEAGLALYREMYEVEAQRALETAVAQRDVRALEAAVNRYFVTFSSAKALYATGDLLMHEGRFRAAIQAFRTLLEIYPERNRERIAELSDLYVRLKIAFCFLQIGETRKAHELLAELQRDHPDGSVRLQGELVPVSALAQSELFAGAVRPAAANATPSAEVLHSLDEGLVPLWQYRYAVPDAYRPPVGGNNERGIVIVEGGAPAAPRYSQYRPGTSVQFDGERLAFMDHFRLRIHELGSGMALLQSDETDAPPKPQQGRARARIPVYDWATLRVAIDTDRYYCVVGAAASLPALLPVLRNDLVAYDRTTLQPLWRATDWKQDGRNYDEVTFLASPTVFGPRLLVPVLVKGAYGLQCIDAATGEPHYRVYFHTAGTELARAPAMPVTVHGGTAYVLTNAGAVAAVDAYTGDLLWIRRYERTDPMRPTLRARSSAQSQQQLAARQPYRHVTLDGFAPAELIAADGRLVLAPCDGDALLCLDGANGELLWVLSKPNAGKLGGDEEVQVIGHNSRYLYLGGRRVTCVEISTGRRMWDIDAPEPPTWMGRGLVSEERVVLPGTRQLWSLPAGGGIWSAIELQPLSIGQEPLAPPVNLFAGGPYLVACYEGGIEVFASLETLYELAQAATDPLQRADLLVQAQDLATAIDVLEPLCSAPERAPEERARIAKRALALVRDVALERAGLAARDEALALVDRARAWAQTRPLLLQWQLLRIELYRALEEPENVERELDVLDRLVEGRQ